MFVEGYRLVETPIALNGHFHAHFYPRLNRDLALLQPDLLHIDEEPYNLAAWQTMRWAVRHRRPALFFTWQNLDRRYPPPFNWMERYNYRHAVHAIAGNHEATRVLEAKGYRGPITVIPQFGIDPELFFPASTAEPIVPTCGSKAGRWVCRWTGAGEGRRSSAPGGGNVQPDLGWR